jgi:hypothetical protein
MMDITTIEAETIGDLVTLLEDTEKVFFYS